MLICNLYKVSRLFFIHFAISLVSKQLFFFTFSKSNGISSSFFIIIYHFEYLYLKVFQTAKFLCKFYIDINKNRLFKKRRTHHLFYTLMLKHNIWWAIYHSSEFLSFNFNIFYKIYLHEFNDHYRVTK